jgi:hypothetical protein
VLPDDADGLSCTDPEMILVESSQQHDLVVVETDPRSQQGLAPESPHLAHPLMADYEIFGEREQEYTIRPAPSRSRDPNAIALDAARVVLIEQVNELGHAL